MRILILVILLLSFSSMTTFAFEVDDIGYSKIHPASPLYFLKTVRESIELKLAQTTRVKYLRQLEFATRRLRETKSLLPINQDLIPPTLEKYTAHLKNLPDKHSPNDEFGPIMRNNLVIHLKILRQIHDLATSPRAKLFTRSTMNRLIKREDVSLGAKALVCDFFAKEASSSALNQTEQVVLRNRAQDCLNQLTAGKVSRTL